MEQPNLGTLLLNLIQNPHLRPLFQAQAGGTTGSLLINPTLSLSHASSAGPSQASTLLLYLKQDFNTTLAYILPPGSDQSHIIKFYLWSDSVSSFHTTPHPCQAHSWTSFLCLFDSEPPYMSHLKTQV